MAYHKDIANTIRNLLPKEKRKLLNTEQIMKLKNATEFALILAASPIAISMGNLGVELMKGIERLFYDKNGRKLLRKDSEAKAIRTVYYLRTKKFIRLRWAGDDFIVFLTKLGRKKIQNINFNNLTVPKQKHWNGKWWLIAADIPTKKHKRGADLLRNKLKEMIFFPLQRTLWLYPYDPREEIQYVASHYQIAHYVTAMEINRLDIDDEKKLKKFSELGFVLNVEVMML